MDKGSCMKLNLPIIITISFQKPVSFWNLAPIPAHLGLINHQFYLYLFIRHANPSTYYWPSSLGSQQYGTLHDQYLQKYVFTLKQLRRSHVYPTPNSKQAFQLTPNIFPDNTTASMVLLLSHVISVREQTPQGRTAVSSVSMIAPTFQKSFFVTKYSVKIYGPTNVFDALHILRYRFCCISNKIKNYISGSTPPSWKHFHLLPTPTQTNVPVNASLPSNDPIPSPYK